MKLALLIMIMMVGVTIGVYVKGCYLRRERLLMAYIQAFERILLHVTIENKPTFDIIEQINEDERFKDCTVFSYCNDRLKNGEGFESGYRHAVEQAFTKTPLLTEDVAVIAELSQVLGGYETDELASQLRVMISKLKQLYNDAVTLTKTQGKMYQTLISLGFVAVSIVLL